MLQVHHTGRPGSLRRRLVREDLSDAMTATHNPDPPDSDPTLRVAHPKGLEHLNRCSPDSGRRLVQTRRVLLSILHAKRRIWIARPLPTRAAPLRSWISRNTGSCHAACRADRIDGPRGTVRCRFGCTRSLLSFLKYVSRARWRRDSPSLVRSLCNVCAAAYVRPLEPRTASSPAPDVFRGNRPRGSPPRLRLNRSWIIRYLVVDAARQVPAHEPPQHPRAWLQGRGDRHDGARHERPQRPRLLSRRDIRADRLAQIGEWG